MNTIQWIGIGIVGLVTLVCTTDVLIYLYYRSRRQLASNSG